MSFIRNPTESWVDKAVLLGSVERQEGCKLVLRSITFIYECNFLKIFICFHFGCAGSSLSCRLFSSCRGGATLCCNVRAAHCRRFSLVVEPGLQVHRLTSCGAWAQLLTHGTFPDQRSNLPLLPWQVDSWHWAAREAPNVTLECYSYGRKRHWSLEGKVFCCVPLHVGCSQEDTLEALTHASVSLPPRQVRLSSTE